MIKPKLFRFIINGKIVNWGAKGCFSVDEIPVKELGAEVSDKSGFVILTG